MIDLHIHTNYSDGTDSVEELLTKANNMNLDIISITDHDSVDAYYELEENKNLRQLYRGKIITGAELKTYYKGVSIEMLAYGFDYKKLKIHKIRQVEILEHLKKVADNLKLKYDEKELVIDKKNPAKQFAGFVLGKELLRHEENASILNTLGNFEAESFFRQHQSNKNSPFYFNEASILIDITETISRIHEAGGLAFLAHGYIYPFENKDEIIEEIIQTTEIDGIECIHSNFSKEEMEKAFKICEKYNIYSSGGTDYHAKNKIMINLGTGMNNNVHVENKIIDNWIDKVTII